MRSLETGVDGWALPRGWKRLDQDQVVFNLRTPNPERMIVIKQAFDDGMTADRLFELTNIDPWFLAQLEGLHQVEQWINTQQLGDLSADDWFEVKRRGFSDSQIARYLSTLLGLLDVEIYNLQYALQALQLIPILLRGQHHCG